MDLSGHEGEIPSPITAKFSGAYGHSLPSDSPSLHSSSDGPPLPPFSTAPIEEQQATIHSTKKLGGAVVRYRECLKNHAASIGGNATDGCGEFMPSGEEGTLEALKCSACSCHRNFHRKEIEGEYHHHHLKERNFVGHKGVLISRAEGFGYYNNPASHSLMPSPLPHQMVMPLGALQASEPDQMEGVGGARAAQMVKKRFRTKFTPEQKEKMLNFAHRIGWRLQRQEEGMVQQFCQEIGVKRRVLKVWMHNNKHSLAKKELPPA
ncbi:zinc-finger homeodomain protein 2 [Elaeis guineensis]|uniref:Zinc-finger homeodomain protein 4 n=1 Tax=Elaeis guineensis var. tenera TaxID=51953 RepID=A0A6I9RJP7_ELAGV|nr:zinc-finger homeodomain protein 4 [Elaeis guineensis]